MSAAALTARGVSSSYCSGCGRTSRGGKRCSHRYNNNYGICMLRNRLLVRDVSAKKLCFGCAKRRTTLLLANNVYSKVCMRSILRHRVCSDARTRKPNAA